LLSPIPTFLPYLVITLAPNPSVAVVAFVRVDAPDELYHPQLIGHVTLLTATPAVLNLAERHPPLFIIVVADVHQVLQDRCQQ